eukprot:m.129907 g.129907  ORF g.129907 m.129907 type:complete len:57 (+) comp14586_c0_seq7:1244-1414(+)
MIAGHVDCLKDKVQRTKSNNECASSRQSVPAAFFNHFSEGLSSDTFLENGCKRQLT